MSNIFNLFFSHTLMATLISNTNAKLNVKTVLFQKYQFNVNIPFNSICPIDRTLSGIPIPGYSRPESNGNEGLLRIPQRSSITETSQSDCLSYLGHSFGKS